MKAKTYQERLCVSYYRQYNTLGKIYGRLISRWADMFSALWEFLKCALICAVKLPCFVLDFFAWLWVQSPLYESFVVKEYRENKKKKDENY